MRLPKPYYQEDGIVIYHGDCRDILPHLDPVDLVLTDPPYGISYETGHRVKGVTPWNGQILNDNDTSVRDEVLSFVKCAALVFGSRKSKLPDKCRQVLIWDKGPALGMGALDIPWKPSYEEIYVLGSGWIGCRDEGSVIYCSPVQSMAKNGRQHPNEKPIQLLTRLLAKCPLGTVLDPFMGSGTTLRAAKDLVRKAIGIEIEEKYCEIAVKRLQQEVFQFDDHPHV